MFTFSNLFKKKTQIKEEIKKEGMDRLYHKELFEVHFSNVFGINKNYLLAYLDWSSKYGRNLRFSDEIKQEVKDKNDFEYYVILKKYFEKDFKNFLIYIKNDFKPGTICKIDITKKDKIFETYGDSRIEYISLENLKIKNIFSNGYFIQHGENGRYDYFKKEWVIGKKFDLDYLKLLKVFKNIKPDENVILNSEKKSLIEELKNSIGNENYQNFAIKNIIEDISQIKNIENLKTIIENKTNIIRYGDISEITREGIKIELYYFRKLLENLGKK